MAILFAMILCSGQLSINSYALSSPVNNSVKNPFAKPDQISFDFFPSDSEKKPATTDDLSSPMLNSLFQGLDNREVCGDKKDNDKNGLVDENCSALPSSQPDSLGQLPPQNSIGEQPDLPQNGDQNPPAEPEICGDGEDNDKNGLVDENCSALPSSQPDSLGQLPPQNSIGEQPDLPQNGDQNPPAEPEICGDEEDNNGNGKSTRTATINHQVEMTVKILQQNQRSAETVRTIMETVKSTRIATINHQVEMTIKILQQNQRSAEMVRTIMETVKSMRIATINHQVEMTVKILQQNQRSAEMVRTMMETVKSMRTATINHQVEMTVKILQQNQRSAEMVRIIMETVKSTRTATINHQVEMTVKILQQNQRSAEMVRTIMETVKSTRTATINHQEEMTVKILQQNQRSAEMVRTIMETVRSTRIAVQTTNSSQISTHF